MSVTATIKEKLEKALNPQTLEIVNDSARHHGHAGDNGTGESHFKLLIVCPSFEGLNRVDRQKLVYNALSEELKTTIHALSVKALTPQEALKL